jgi:hypothetical protein
MQKIGQIKKNLNPNLENFKEPRNRLQGIDSASLYSLAESISLEWIPGLLKSLQIRALEENNPMRQGKVTKQFIGHRIALAK